MEYSVHIIDGLAMDDGSPPPKPMLEEIIPQAMEVTHEEIAFFEALLESIQEKKDD